MAWIAFDKLCWYNYAGVLINKYNNRCICSLKIFQNKGILSQGLRIAPPEAPSTGYMVN